MRVALDLHDFSVVNNRMDLLLKLKEYYPLMKVSLFTVPFDVNREMNVEARINRQGALDLIKKHLDWMQIIPHGLSHMYREMEKCDYQTFKDLVIPSIDEALSKDGLPYEKGFKAPYWMWNEQVVKSLDELGWWGATDRNNPTMPATKRVYTYTHSIRERFWESTNEVVNLHGHIDGESENDLERCLVNLLKIPQEAEWKFVSDFVKDAQPGQRE